MKQCTMNCSPGLYDPRTKAEIMRGCEDCIEVPDPQRILHGDELRYTCYAMARFGGSFAQAISTAGFAADSHNSARLQTAFRDLFEKYGPGSDFYLSVLSEDGRADL